MEDRPSRAQIAALQTMLDEAFGSRLWVASIASTSVGPHGTDHCFRAERLGTVPHGVAHSDPETLVELALEADQRVNPQPTAVQAGLLSTN
jgi:hypothetical protein